MRPYAGTQAVLRAVGLLKALGEARELGLAELTRRSGLNRTTVFRLLTALESERMIERSPGGDTFRIGPEILALGGRAGRGADLRSAARPSLLALAGETRETATLEILAGSEVLILDEVAGRHVVGAMPSVGTRWPVHATSTGKALLAFGSAADREAALRAPLAAVTPRTIVERAALEAELERVRERGYATSSEELETGFVAVSAPVAGADGHAVAALGVGGPKSRLTPRRVADIASRVPEAARQVAARLGQSDGGSGGGRDRAGAPRREMRR